MSSVQRQRAPQRAPASIQLPPRPRHFVGRAELLRDIENALRAPESGWFTITGMPGVGKSARAREAALAMASHARLTLLPHSPVSRSDAALGDRQYSRMWYAGCKYEPAKAEVRRKR